MIFTSSNWEDISRYYKNTYVKFKEMGDMLFYIRSVNSDVIKGTDQDGTEFELWLSDDHPYEVEYPLPSKSYFQYKKAAHLLQRHPAKQYQRGISTNNVRILGLAKGGAMRNVEMNFDILKSFVSKPAFPTFDKAIANKEKFASVVLSPRFAYVPDVSAIFVDGISIATVDKDNKQVAVRARVFVPEIKALIGSADYKVV